MGSLGTDGYWAGLGIYTKLILKGGVHLHWPKGKGRGVKGGLFFPGQKFLQKKIFYGALGHFLPPLGKPGEHGSPLGLLKFPPRLLPPVGEKGLFKRSLNFWEEGKKGSCSPLTRFLLKEIVLGGTKSSLSS